MANENVNWYKIEQMRRFYEIFPYPNRPLLLSPLLRGQLGAHGAFGELVARNKIEQAWKMLPNSLGETMLGEVKFAQVLESLETHFPKTNKILIVGCGTDEPLLFRLLHPSQQITCIDLSKENIKIAKRKLFIHKFLYHIKNFWKKMKKVEFIVGDANVILKQKYIGQFNYIQCFGVLHHQPHPEIMLSGIAERLTPGGCLRLMVYSYYGRMLERKIQKRYEFLWENFSQIKRFKITLYLNFLVLRIWQLLNFLGLKKSTSMRFKYLGMNSKSVADALMHPSDPGLPLENILSMTKKEGLTLIFCQAKLDEVGMLYGFENPMEVWEKIVEADKKRNLLSNPILIFTKLSNEK